MQLFSSSPKSQFTLFSPSQNPNSSKPHFRIPIKTLSSSSPPLKIPPLSSSSTSSLTQVETEGFVPVGKPIKEISEEDEDEDDMEENENSKSVLDERLEEIAKKMPMFEPKRGEMEVKEKPLGINFELALYRAKVHARSYQFNQAITILDKCLSLWPEDGRPYVALGKILTKQSKFVEARALYEKGCQATQGENSYIWQCWAVLEDKMGNIKKARELFDAATVADKKHIAAWHGWAILELKQGNVKKARNLLGKGIKYCGGNEYVYQTLALLEAKASRFEQARSLFKQATKCNPKSCASWLAWAQLEVQLENNLSATRLFEKAIKASPKNRFAWHQWGIFEASMGDIEKGRKLLKIGHTLNPKDPVLLQSLALLEYQYSNADLARVLFRRGSELDPRHQPIWTAWGWMEWKEGNLETARQLYQKALSINTTSESAARCLQAWGVLEERVGNTSAARRLFKSSLNIYPQSYITWMTWASMEEREGNSVRAEEIRDLYFQERTEVVDDSSWANGLSDIIDPAIDSLKRFLNFDKENSFEGRDSPTETRETQTDLAMDELGGNSNKLGNENVSWASNDFDLDAFVRKKLFLDTSKLDILMQKPGKFVPKKFKANRSIWTAKNRIPTTLTQPKV